MKRKTLICTIVLSLLLSGCSSELDVFNAEATQETADKMTEILLDNTAFPDEQSKEQLKGIINDVTEQVVETSDGIAEDAASSITENKAVKQGQTTKPETPESYTEINVPEWMLDSVLAESVKQGCVVEKVENSDNTYLIQNTNEGITYYLKTIEENR